MRVIDILSGWQLALYIILVGGSALPALAFVAMYAFMVKWQESVYGKFLLFMGFVVALALGNSSLRIFFPPTPAWVSLIILILIFIMTWWCLLLFLHAWRKGKQEAEDRRNQEE